MERVLQKCIFADLNLYVMSTLVWIIVVIVIAYLIYSFYRKYTLLKNSELQEKSARLIVLTDATFQKTIKTGVTLVDFWAPWCTPCRLQDPAINALADEMDGKVKVCKLNVDEHKKAATKMKIRNIPNIIIFKNGKPVKQLIGVKSQRQIEKALNSVVGE